jgi:hypothetical protein
MAKVLLTAALMCLSPQEACQEQHFKIDTGKFCFFKNVKALKYTVHHIFPLLSSVVWNFTGEPHMTVFKRNIELKTLLYCSEYVKRLSCFHIKFECFKGT